MKLSIHKIPVDESPYEQGDRVINYNGQRWITLSKEFWQQVKSDLATYNFFVNHLKQQEKRIR